MSIATDGSPITDGPDSGQTGLPMRNLPPVLGRLLSGSFWLALKSPLQALIAFWTIPLTIGYIGPDMFGAYGFAWGFGFIQFLLEFGMSSALQRQVAECWTRDDQEGVRRAIACGTLFYTAITVIQVTALLAIAYLAVPLAGYSGASSVLILRLLWLQALAAPFYGVSVVVSSVLQAARRYAYIPRLELLVVVLRFGILVLGIAARLPFVAIVVLQIGTQIAVLLGPSLVVMVRELGLVPSFRGATWTDFRSLTQISLYVFLIQLSVVMADRVDTTILGFALPEGVAGPATAIYQIVSKPFMQIRQTGWTLSFLVMPAVASLAAARDRGSLERIAYDGSRLLIGLLLPVGMLAAIDAGPFLAAWMGRPYAVHAPLLRLFLVATLPLLVTVLVQATIGLGKVRFIALAALAGAIVNLPLSYVLTLRIGMPGVIWGTVLTTLVSNLLLPGWYALRSLEVKPWSYARRTLGPPLAGGVALGVAMSLVRLVGLDAMAGPGQTGLLRLLPLAIDLALGCLAYSAGYLSTPAGRGDVRLLYSRVRRKSVA